MVRILLDHLVEDAGEHQRDGDRVEVGEEEAEGLPGVQEEPEPEGRRTDQHLDHFPAESTFRGFRRAPNNLMLFMTLVVGANLAPRETLFNVTNRQC